MEIITGFRNIFLIMEYEIPRKSAEFLAILHGIQKLQMYKKHTEFHVDGILWTPYFWAEHIIPQISGQTLSFSHKVISFAMHIQ